MTITEKLAYIKGLAEGLKLDDNKDEVKVLKAIIDLLDEMADAVVDLEELYDEAVDVIDEIDEDLANLEEDFYDDCCDCDCDCDCGCCDCDEDDFDDDIAYYEVTCGKCGEVICVDEDILIEGEIECPECGEILEFDFSDIEFDCDCDCCDCEEDAE